MKFVIAYKTKFGSVSAESTNPDELVRVYNDLREIARNIGNGNRQRDRIPSRFHIQTMESRQTGNKRFGRGQTARILREIESKVLATNFFSKPRSTGDTMARLGGIFTSRKVSQALGILHKRGSLKRTGSKNHFRYRK